MTTEEKIKKSKDLIIRIYEQEGILLNEKDKGRKRQINLEIKALAKEGRSCFSESIEDVRRWIIEGFSEDTIIFTQFFGYYVNNEGLTTSQIRTFFGEVKKIQMLYLKSMNDSSKEIPDLTPLRMLVPKLFYSAKRADKKGTYELKDILVSSINAILSIENEKNTEERKRIFFKRFDNFINLFESILAFHKASGGN